MSSVLSALLAPLNADATLTGLLPGGIHTTWATGGTLPRMILAYDSQRTPGYKIRTGTLSIDVFTRVNSVATAITVRDRVIELLEGAILDSDETGPTLRVTLLSEATIPEPDDRSAHYTMALALRFYRAQALGQED